MREIIERLLARWTKSTPRDTYLKYLEQFESANATITTLPYMLTEFWNRVNLKHFENGPTFKDMMYVKIHVRHKTISELTGIMMLATGSLAQDDENSIHEISINQFATNETITLDDYLAGIRGGSVTYYDAVKQLKEAVAKLADVLENTPPGYHCRMLNRMYNDILSVTVTLMQQLKEA